MSTKQQRHLIAVSYLQANTCAQALEFDGATAKKKSCMENKSTKEELPVSWTRPKVTRADTPQQNHA